MPKKILIVDDEPHIVKMIESRLKANGYDTISASDGEEALDKAKQQNPDLIILDIMLPKRDGNEVCSTLKSDVTYQDIPIVMLTAKDQMDDMKEGLEKGADAYVTKPFKPDTLMGVIQGLLGEDK